MVPLKRPPVTVDSAINENNTLMMDNFKIMRKGRPRNRYNLFGDTIVVEHTRNQSS